MVAVWRDRIIRSHVAVSHLYLLSSLPATFASSGLRFAMHHGFLSLLSLPLVFLVLQQQVGLVQAFPAALNWTIFADQPTRIGLNLTSDDDGRRWTYLRLYLSMVLPCFETSPELCQTGAPTCACFSFSFVVVSLQINGWAIIYPG